MELPVNYNEAKGKQRRLVREEYTRIQDGNCCHCKNPLLGEPSKNVMSKTINKKLFPTGFFSNPVHLHHSHTTGMTIGAVHAVCNAVLWQYHGE
jgi:hypothetical protein